MQYELAPSVLSFDLCELSQSVPQLVEAGAGIIHLDVMDGQFVPPISFGAAMAKSLRNHTDAPMEAHLMVIEPEKQFEAFIQAGCSRIIFHWEATPHSHRLVQQLHERGIRAGVAINPATSERVLEPILDEIDLALVMTVNPGWGGQKMIDSALEKVAQLRAKRPDLEIQVDGGIDAYTLKSALLAGANSFVVGSYLLSRSSLEEGVRSIIEQFPKQQ